MFALSDESLFSLNREHSAPIRDLMQGASKAFMEARYDTDEVVTHQQYAPIACI